MRTSLATMFIFSSLMAQTNFTKLDQQCEEQQYSNIEKSIARKGVSIEKHFTRIDRVPGVGKSNLSGGVSIYIIKVKTNEIKQESGIFIELQDIGRITQESSTCIDVDEASELITLLNKAITIAPTLTKNKLESTEILWISRSGATFGLISGDDDPTFYLKCKHVTLYVNTKEAPRFRDAIIKAKSLLL